MPENECVKELQTFSRVVKASVFPVGPQMFLWDESRIARTNGLLLKYTRDRNTCHPPAIARERAAGRRRTTSVCCAHPTLLAKKWAESAAASWKTSVI